MRLFLFFFVSIINLSSFSITASNTDLPCPGHPQVKSLSFFSKEKTLSELPVNICQIFNYNNQNNEKIVSFPIGARLVIEFNKSLAPKIPNRPNKCFRLKEHLSPTKPNVVDGQEYFYVENFDVFVSFFETEFFETETTKAELFPVQQFLPSYSELNFGAKYGTSVYLRDQCDEGPNGQCNIAGLSESLDLRMIGYNEKLYNHLSESERQQVFSGVISIDKVSRQKKKLKGNKTLTVSKLVIQDSLGDFNQDGETDNITLKKLGNNLGADLLSIEFLNDSDC